MKPRLSRVIAALALTAVAGLVTTLVDDLTTPADTSWGSHTLTVDVDTDVSTRVTVTPLDTSWG